MGDGQVSGTERDVQQLVDEFTRIMLSLCDRLKGEIDYDPTRFRHMVAEHGGPDAARRLLSTSRPQLGLETLRWHDRLADSVEAHVLLPRYAALFTDVERRVARQRLAEHGFDVDTFLAPGRDREK